MGLGPEIAHAVAMRRLIEAILRLQMSDLDRLEKYVEALVSQGRLLYKCSGFRNIIPIIEIIAEMPGLATASMSSSFKVRMVRT
jgi:hypothetical protein